jgi:hypothetical protein
VADPVTIQDIYDLFKTSQVEFDRRMAESKAEADRRMERLEQLAANASREVGRLGDRWGTFVENMVEPAVLRLFQERGIEISRTFRRAKSTRPEARMENDTCAIPLPRRSAQRAGWVNYPPNTPRQNPCTFATPVRWAWYRGIA